jgi:hypothetical protein
MQNILAERTVTVELDGHPARTIRVVVGLPAKISNREYQTVVELHGPEAGAVLERSIGGVDAWQSVRHAFWICRDLVRSLVPASARLTCEGDENWSDELPAVP